MQPDQTRIVIRGRGFLEGFDLALRVLCSMPGPWLGWTLAGAIPCLFVCTALLWPAAGYTPELADSPELVLRVVFFYFPLQVLAVFILSPLSTAPLTLYLGQSMFLGPTRLGVILPKFLQSLHQLVLAQVLFRFVSLFLLGLPLLFTVMAARFLNEVILLERNPLVLRGKHKTTSMLRNQRIHESHFGDNLSAFMGSAMIGAVLAAMLLAGIVLLQLLLLGWVDIVFFLRYELPLVLWLVSGYLATARFVAYLDLRTREEGWEIELRLRAEAMRLSGQLS